MESLQSIRHRTPARGVGPARAYLACLFVALVVFALACLFGSGEAGGAIRGQQPRTARPPVRRLQRINARARWLEQRVVYLAWRATGIPYRWGGASLRSGFDCSGLVSWVYSRVGFRLPHYTYAQWHYGRRVARTGLRAGDLVFFSRLGHVGIYIGGGRLIHAPHPGARVQVARLSGWFASSFAGARRIIAL